MDSGQTVFQGRISDGKDILIRYPQEGDAEQMRDYINTLSREQTFITFQGEQISLEDEIKYLNDQLQKIKDQKTVQLLVVCNNQVVGNAEINLKDKTESHEGVLAISIAKEFRGKGLGEELMRVTLEEAEKNLPELRIITLSVFEENVAATEMYRKLGFKEYGRLPDGSLYKGQYVDDIFMYKKIK
jgi:ribosomal protein S18 acetylase RimI-like enzyme